MPTLLDRCRLARPEDDTHNARIYGVRFLWAVPANIAAPNDLEIFEPSLRKLASKLCFQQSTGDSTGPEIYVSPGALQNRFIHHNIGNLDAAGGFQNPVQLPEDIIFIQC